MDPLINAAPTTHTRESLYEVLDNYLAALATRTPSRVPWAKTVRNTENNVALMVGDGLWGTLVEMGDYQLRFVDIETGQIGFFGYIYEIGETSAFTLRLKVNIDLLVEEVETLVVRQLDSGIKFENQRYWDKEILNENVPVEQRSARARMISLSDGYFDTLQLNDGTFFTKFHPDCNRVENGVQTTNNEEFANMVPLAGRGCEEQFKMGNYRYDDELRARRYPLVDEERGLVFSSAFIDHSGKLGEYQLTDGTTATAPMRRPHSFYVLELFKIQDGMIYQIEANFITVPYKMPSPWDDNRWA